MPQILPICISVGTVADIRLLHAVIEQGDIMIYLQGKNVTSNKLPLWAHSRFIALLTGLLVYGPPLYSSSGTLMMSFLAACSEAFPQSASASSFSAPSMLIRLWASVCRVICFDKRNPKSLLLRFVSYRKSKFGFLPHWPQPGHLAAWRFGLTATDYHAQTIEAQEHFQWYGSKYWTPNVTSTSS